MQKLTKFRKQYLLYAIALIVMLVSGCASTQTTQISLPGEVKANIEKVAPQKEYGFYALKASIPQKAEDLPERILVVCDLSDDIAVNVAASSLNVMKVPLFKSAVTYTVSENLISPNREEPGATMSQEYSISSDDGGGQTVFPCSINMFGKDTPVKTLLKKSIEEMQKNNKTVLLTKKDIASKNQNELVEIVFK